MSFEKIDKSIRSTSEQNVNDYIEWLESVLTSFEAKGVKKLIVSLDMIVERFAEDALMVAKNQHKDIDGILLPMAIIDDDKNSKLFDRFMVLISKIGDIKNLSDIAETFKLEVKEEKKSAANQKIGDVNIPLVEQMPRKNIGTLNGKN